MSIAAEVTIAAPVDRVWHALRDRAELHRWHGWAADSLDAEIEEIYFAQAIVDDEKHTLITSGTRIEVSEGTRVTFAMTSPPEDPMWDGWYETIADGWVAFAQQLRFALERHPGEDRTTVYLEGPQERGVTAAVGERYGTAGLTGTVWFRTDRLLGLTVDSWGDGLLVLMPDSAVLTAYGTTPELP